MLLVIDWNHGSYSELFNGISDKVILGLILVE